MAKYRHKMTVYGGNDPARTSYFNSKPHPMPTYGDLTVSAGVRNALTHGFMTFDLLPKPSRIDSYVDPRGVCIDWLRVGADMKRVMLRTDELMRQLEVKLQEIEANFQESLAAAQGSKDNIVTLDAEPNLAMKDISDAFGKVSKVAFSAEFAEAFASFQEAVAKETLAPAISNERSRVALDQALVKLEAEQHEREPC